MRQMKGNKSIKKAPKYNKNEIIFGIISLSFECLSITQIIPNKIFFCSVVMKNFEIIALSLNRMFDIAPFLVSKPFFLEELMPSLGK